MKSCSKKAWLLAPFTLSLLLQVPIWPAQATELADDELPQMVWKVATFEADITIPLGHACMGGGVEDAREIIDPLWAKGFVLRPMGLKQPGSARLAPPPADSAATFPLVVLALDWCQLNNDGYDRFREVLADVARTTRQRVLLATVHQHDAPIFDLRAQQLLDQHGLQGWHCDPQYYEEALQRVAEALRDALGRGREVTHLGIGRSAVEKVASNRRVEEDGRVHWGRGSAGQTHYGDYPEGEIDPWLRTFSLWNDEQPLVAWSSYAVHPMSYYGQGQVSADFPGMARDWRQRDDPSVLQIYFTGCAGDVTAGKYNSGNPANRLALAERIYRAMTDAWTATTRHSMQTITFREAALHMTPRDDTNFTIPEMQRILADPAASRWKRISAALGLSWRDRVAAARPIDVPCLDFNHGQAQFVILPAESFVGYQLKAQQLRPQSSVMTAGFGDGAPGYIPTDAAWKDGYSDDYCWVAPMTDQSMLDALQQVMAAPREDTPSLPEESISRQPNSPASAEPVKNDDIEPDSPQK